MIHVTLLHFLIWYVGLGLGSFTATTMAMMAFGYQAIPRLAVIAVIGSIIFGPFFILVGIYQGLTRWNEYQQ